MGKQLIYTRTTTNTAGIHNTHALINRTHIRTGRPVHTSQQVTAELVYAAHIDYGHNTQSVHDNDAYARTALATYSRPYNLLQLVRSILPILRAMLSPLGDGIPTTNAHHEYRYTYQTSAAEPYVQMPRRKRRRAPLPPMVHGTEHVRFKG